MRVLAVGAHPDDLEIGAAILTSRIVEAGHDARLLILTDSERQASERRAEAIASAGLLGIQASAISFLGEADGSLAASAPLVARLRSHFAELGWQPDLVICHSGADSHNDHRAANGLLRATFREKVMLFYSVHVSAEPGHFTPQHFVELSQEESERKASALGQHGSQRETIERRSLVRYEESLGSLSGLARCEAFEVDVQEGASEAVLADAMLWNDSRFHRLWSSLIGTDLIYLLHEDFDSSYPIDSHESLGREALRNAFVEKWVAYPRKRVPLVERFSNSPEGALILETENTLLAGGSVSNALYRNRAIRIRGLDWVIEHEIPRGTTAFAQQRSTGGIVAPRFRAARLDADVGIFTVMPSPFSAGRRLVSCAGAHGEATRAMLEFCADPSSNEELLSLVLAGLNGPGFQAVLWADPASLDLRVELLATVKPASVLDSASG